MKYELIKETGVFFNTSLYRIKSLIDLPGVPKGTLGGWVEGENNLSQYDNAWVFDNARVYGNARVLGNARVFGKARVLGNAVVYGNARVHGKANVYGNAWVYDSAEVYGKANVCGNAVVFGKARVYDSARVYGETKVFGNACVFGSAMVYDSAEVYGDCVVTKTPKTLSGFKHKVTITDNLVCVGCQVHPLDVWQSRGGEIIQANGGSPEQSKAWNSIIVAIAHEHMQ